MLSPKLMRLVFACEFLIALIAIFAAWSEIGGQAALDLMHWAWKFGFSVALSIAFVGYSAALVAEENIWNMRSARWLSAILILLLAIGAVTYYYALQADSDASDDNTQSAIRAPFRLLSEHS